MKRNLIASLLSVALMTLASAPASAAFVGNYDAANWSGQTNGGTGLIIINDPTKESVTLTSSDANPGPAQPVNTDFTITALASGTVSFDWAYDTTDLRAFFDPFGWLLAPDTVSPLVFTKVTDDAINQNPNATDQFGSVSFLVNAGEVFGFRIFASDDCCGAATVTISNFNGPTNPTPEPGSLALLGLALAGLARIRRRRD